LAWTTSEDPNEQKIMQGVISLFSFYINRAKNSSLEPFIGLLALVVEKLCPKKNKLIRYII